MEKPNIRTFAVTILISAAVYILLDVPVRVTGFLEFGAYIGIKNFLPAVLGLVFGWCGAVGCLLGCVFSCLVTRSPVNELLFEGLCVMLFALGIWLLWHIGKKPQKVHLKRALDYLKYAVLTALFSTLCGVVSLLFLKGAFLSCFIAYFAMSLLVGTPVIILLTSIMCVIPIMPPWTQLQPDIAAGIDSSSGSLDCFNDLLEEFCLLHKIDRKRLFGLQSSVEEVMIRIFDANPTATVNIAFYYADSASLWFEYGGSRHNPFVSGKNEQSEDLFGLQLIKHRALRASYKYWKGTNKIHIVI